MSLFNKILSQIKERLDLEESKKEEIISIIFSVTNVHLVDDQITLKKGTLFLKVPPTIRMAILLKKEKALSLFKEKNIPIYAIV